MKVTESFRRHIALITAASVVPSDARPFVDALRAAASEAERLPPELDAILQGAAAGIAPEPDDADTLAFGLLVTLHMLACS